MGQSAAASESHSETRFGGASTADVFAFEDLLDFSNDDDDEVELGEGEFEKGAPPRCCPLLDAPDSVVCSTYANNTAAAATCDADLGAAGLCPVPYEELNAELEWVSDHLDEDEPALSIEDAEKLRLISGSGTTNPTPLYASPSSSSSTLTSVPSSSTSSGDRCSSSSYSTCSNDNSLQQLRLINDDEYALLDADGGDDGIDAAAVLPQPLHSRGARSKRSRADPGSLASRLAVLLTSTATTADAADLGAFHANVSACSSSSSYNTTDAVPFDTHRKKPPKVIVNPPSKKITKPVVLQRQQPQSRCYGAEDEPVRRCLHCATDQTPQWRAGPMGPKTLCNACGVRYKSGRLVPEYRPAASPTFVMSKHSNSHRKVMELRRQKEHHQMIKMMQLHETDGERHIRRSSSTAHMFPLAAGDGLYLEAPAAGADTAPPDDFLMHHRVGPDFRHII